MSGSEGIVAADSRHSTTPPTRARLNFPGNFQEVTRLISHSWTGVTDAFPRREGEIQTPTRPCTCAQIRGSRRTPSSTPVRDKWQPPSSPPAAVDHSRAPPPPPRPVRVQDVIQQHHYDAKTGVLTPSTTLACGPAELKPHGPRYMYVLSALACCVYLVQGGMFW